MKKMIFTALAALLIAVPAVQAQKVNQAALISKIEKSDAEIADAKKNTKSATWLNRGKALYEAASTPTKSLFENMDVNMLKLAEGDPTSTEEVTLIEKPYTAWIYPYFTIYVADGKIVAWTQTKDVYPGALDKALEAYAKAYELDPKSAEKVKEGLKQISDFCSQVGNVGLTTGEHAIAAAAYRKAFEAQSMPAFGAADAALLYYAGYLKTVEGGKTPAAFVEAAELLNKALELNYTDEAGNIYYYLYHSYYGQKENDPAFVGKAKDVLLTGISKFPKNELILDGLMSLYTVEKGIGDPADLITMIEEAIKANPENIDLWFGRGRIFHALKNFDESIASFQKVAELRPEMYEGNYYTGILCALKGDDMINEMNQKQYSSQTAYDADLKSVNDVYMAAIPWFEKAIVIKPGDLEVLDFLKSLCFRLRDEPGIMDKYNTYNEQFKKAKGE